MRAKLGLLNEEEEDEALISDLLKLMNEHHADYTNTFRALTLNKKEENELFKAAEFVAWYEKWKKRLERQPETEAVSKGLMKKSNPSVIPRNHRVEEALKAAEKDGDYSVMERLIEVTANPYAYSTEQEEYTSLPPEADGPYRTFCGT
jgi:uncharacterized protein YdiU (UPF0061 family)